MKKTAITPLKGICLLAFGLATLSLQAQDRKFSVQVQAGPLFSTVKPNPKEAFDPKYRTGFFAGAGARWALSEHWGIPLDVRFSQRGFSYDTEGTLIILNNQFAQYRGAVDYRLRYLDFTPQVEYRPIPNLSLAVGPYLSWQLGEAIRYGDVIDWTSTQKNQLFTDTDLGLSAKLSGNLGHLSVFAAYQFGLADISNIILTDDVGQFLQVLEAKSRAVMAGVGWRF